MYRHSTKHIRVLSHNLAQSHFRRIPHHILDTDSLSGRHHEIQIPRLPNPFFVLDQQQVPFPASNMIPSASSDSDPVLSRLSNPIAWRARVVTHCHRSLASSAVPA